MSTKTLLAALAVAVSAVALAAPSAEAKHKHHRFFFKPYYQVYEPVCGKWVYSRRYHRYRCAWWY